ncbi:MAG: MFS transporter [Cellvibrionaceae bacterium]
MKTLFAQSGIGRALRHRTFATYIIAHAGSVIGLWIQRIAIQWLVWTLTGSYAWLGAIALAESLTSMIFSLGCGPLADRFDRVRMAYLTQGLLMLVALGLAFVTYLDLATIPVIIAFVIVTGMIEGVWAPVRLSIMPNMVPREDMPAAVAITSMMFTAAIFIGPAIGGIIIAAVDVEGAFFANALSYIGLLVVFSRIKMPRQAVRSGEQKSFISDLKSGFVYVIRHKALRAIVIFGTVFSFLIRPFREFFAGIADEVFNRGADGLALLASASGFGALVGAVSISVYGRNEGMSKILQIVAAATAGMLFIFATTGSFVVSMIMAAGLSACVTVFGTGAQMLIQMNVADSMRGRVMSVWQSQFRGVPAIGAWCIGLIELSFDLKYVLVGSAILFLVFVLSTMSWGKDFKLLEVTESRDSI